jgi:GT2 family glycosyltransferase
VTIDRTRHKDPTNLSGPSVRETRRSYVEEQYPTFVRNNHLRARDLRRLQEEARAFARKPLLSILIPVVGPADPARSERPEWTLDSVLRQIYPNWELLVYCDGAAEGRAKVTLSRYERMDGRVKVANVRQDTRGSSGGVAGVLNAALSGAGGEFVWSVGEGDELSAEALFEVARELQERPEADLLYTDEDAIDERGVRTEPRFKPGFSPDLLLSTDYIGRSGIYRRCVLEGLGGLREGFEGAEGHDLLLRLTERTQRIVHLPKVLYHRRKQADGPEEAPNPAPEGVAEGSVGDGHVRERTRKALSEALERRGLGRSVEDGLLAGTFRVRPKIKGKPKVSIIIPSRDNVSLLKNCVDSIERLTTYRNYEILVVDNDSSEPATLEYLAHTPHHVIPFREEFNYSSINNFAVRQAEGEYVLLLNDDTEVIDGGWLEAMLEHAQRPEVGAVGAKLLYPDGRVQHAGVVTGVGGLGQGLSTHSYWFYPLEDPGHLGTLATTTNYSAVTAAYMLLPKAVYEDVGGLDDENLRVSFNDVDLCLRIRERGFLVVYTPHAELYHYESVSRGYKNNPAEGLYMIERWGTVLDEDPYYNPHFSRGSGDFNLRADLLRPRVLRQGGAPKTPQARTMASCQRAARNESNSGRSFRVR